MLQTGLHEKGGVVYHLVGKTDWSKVAVNGTHQKPEWEFSIVWFSLATESESESES